MSKNSIYAKKLREKRLMNGLRQICGEPLDREGALCKKCLREQNQYKKDTRDWLLAHKICPRCGKNDIFGDEKSCPECRAKENRYVMKSREGDGRLEYNKKHREWAKKEHHRRIEVGICTRCGKRKADYGFKTCGICREKIRNQKKRLTFSNKRDNRVKNGLCFFCDSPVKEGYKVCEKHYEMNVQKARSKKAKEARNKLEKSGILY